MGLQEAIQNIWSSDYVQKNPNKAYKASYASEYAAVSTYLNGGAEPNFSAYSKLGKGLCEAEKERRLAQEPVPPPPPDPVPEPEPPPVGTVIFDGGFDTGNLSQWPGNWQGPNGRIAVVQAEQGVTPRKGSHMARFDVASGDNAAWGYANVDMVYTSQFNPPNRNHFDLLGDDRYYGFSLYMPSARYNPYPGKFNYCFELHGNTSGQAPVKLNVDPTTTPDTWSVELHVRDVGSGWDPTFITAVGAMEFDKWVDFVFHVKWSTGADGKLEVYRSGQKVLNYDGVTWGGSGAMGYIKRVFGMYRDEHSALWSFYADAFRVGTTYDIVK